MKKGSFFNYKNALKKPQEVRELYLSGHKDNNLNQLHIFENLEFLELKGFQELKISDNFLKLKKLRKLCLLDNFFTEIPKIIFELEGLTYLDISRGGIKVIPKEISNLKSLSVLHLQHLNHLKQLPEDIAELSNLQHLNLQNNKLQKLPKNIGQLQKLTFLNISQNLIKTLPRSFAQLNLEKFYVGNTPFSTNYPNKHKKVLELLKQFKRREEIFKQRTLAFLMFLEDYEAVKSDWQFHEILSLLDFGNQIIRQNTIMYLHQETTTPFEREKPLYLRVIGKHQNLDLQQYIASLETKGIFVEKRWNQKINLIFIGEFPKQQLTKALETEIDIFPITYLKDFLHTLEKPYLANNDAETNKMAHSLADLLRSEEESNQELGLEMALGGGINEVYFYDLLLLYIWNANRKIKNMAEKVLEKYLSSQTFIHLKNNHKNYHNNLSEDNITNYLSSLINEDIDPNHLGYNFYQATARGKKFCLRYGEAFKQVIKNEIKNSVLHLNNLSLSELNPEIAHFTFLKMLYLGNNKLKILPEGFSSLSKLKLLVLTHNQLKTIPNVIFSLSKLRNLDLSKNNLENIPETIKQLKNLVNLNLSSNKIKDLPLSIEHLKNLKSLNISKNPIVKNKDFIRKLSNLLPNCKINF